jgi:phosphatidylinositol glycan class K
MPKYSAIWLILGVVLACGSSQKAILIDSSLGYYNYRQVSNILKVYQHLKANGFRDDDILLLIGEMTPCC